MELRRQDEARWLPLRNRHYGNSWHYFLADPALRRPAALRETSNLFALAISPVALKVRLTVRRLAAALLIVSGVAVLRQ